MFIQNRNNKFRKRWRRSHRKFRSWKWNRVVIVTGSKINSIFTIWKWIKSKRIRNNILPRLSKNAKIGTNLLRKNNNSAELATEELWILLGKKLKSLINNYKTIVKTKIKAWESKPLHHRKAGELNIVKGILMLLMWDEVWNCPIIMILIWQRFQWTKTRIRIIQNCIIAGKVLMKSK